MGSSPSRPSSAILSNDERNYPPGYPRLAYWFSRSPNHLHLRRFSQLSIGFLLYQQNKLATLERELHNLEQQCSAGNSEEGDNNLTNFEHMGKTRRVKYEKIGSSLKEYEDGLIRASQLNPLSWNPDRLSKIQEIFALYQERDGSYPLTGLESKSWGTCQNPSDHALDLVQIPHELEPSPLNRFFFRLFQGTRLEMAFRRLARFFFCRVEQPDSLSQHGLNRRHVHQASVISGNYISCIILVLLLTMTYSVGDRLVHVPTVLFFGCVLPLILQSLDGLLFSTVLLGFFAVQIALLDLKKPA
ncbi:hypothetical protein B0J11DRAFT_615203 [Dendryphion nanum]|uniref:DUF6594 domain-containing protein n=1 Tax=Dendryphion nanum TaxID=256645 RepID=A0A9P9DRD9_9PLEO|nr:hypothetical protein B0J11DRAFT_615203 [Dendryphion nanum]